jgi:hypothetical protein
VTAEECTASTVDKREGYHCTAETVDVLAGDTANLVTIAAGAFPLPGQERVEGTFSTRGGVLQ